MEVMSSRMAHKDNLKLFHKFFNIFNNALSFFGLSFIERKSSGEYSFSLKRLFYGMFIVMFVLYVFYEQITRFYPVGLDNIVLLLLFLYMAVVGTLMAILMIITAILNAKGMVNILNNPEYFELFNLDTYDYVVNSTIIQFVYACFVVVACYISDYVASADFTLFNAVKIMMFFFFPMYNSFCITEFFIYHYWLKRWYWHINQGLEALLDHDWWKNTRSHVCGVEELSKNVENGFGTGTWIRSKSITSVGFDFFA